MTKDIIHLYRQEKENLHRAEGMIADLVNRKKAIEEELISLNERIHNAESERKKTLERFVLGEISQSVVDELKGILIQIQGEVSDRRELLSLCDAKINELQKQLGGFSGMRNKLKAAEKNLWLSIYKDYLVEIREKCGDLFERCSVAYCFSNNVQVVQVAPTGQIIYDLFDGKIVIPVEKVNRLADEIKRKYFDKE